MQWMTPEQRERQMRWEEGRAREILAAGQAAVRLGEEDMGVLRLMPEAWGTVLRSLTLFQPTDYLVEALGRFPQLEELTFTGGWVGDKSVPVLSKLKALTVLTMASRVDFSPEGLAALKAALPGCRIVGATECTGTFVPPPAPPAPARKPWWKFW